MGAAAIVAIPKAESSVVPGASVGVWPALGFIMLMLYSWGMRDPV